MVTRRSPRARLWSSVVIPAVLGIAAATLAGVSPAAATVAPGTTILVADPATASCVGAGVVSASLDARYLLIEDCTSRLVRRDRVTGTDLDVTTDRAGLHIQYSAGSTSLSSDGQVVT